VPADVPLKFSAAAQKIDIQCSTAKTEMPATSCAGVHRFSSAPVASLQYREDFSDAQLGPWIEAAKTFELNTDFDLGAVLPEESLELPDLMGIMKVQSGGKRTIQALGDKILLNRILSNLGVPQMPILLAMHGSVDASKVVELVDGLERSRESDAFDIVVKPTHLSNGSGSLIITTPTWRSLGYDAQVLTDHMREYMKEQAHETESAALQSLIPGFIVQPRYRSCVDFGFPIEIRVVTLWGKTRVGIWWFGTDRTVYDNNAWFVPVVGAGKAETESWKALPAMPNRTAAHSSGVQLVLKAMPTLARAAEKIARATGAPFLRSDFFVGSSKYGVRLNEVAYCSNIELRRISKNLAGYADDQAAIAQILHRGFKLCRRQAPEHFLSKLGAQGSAYEPAWWKFWSQTPGMQISQLSNDAPSVSYCQPGPSAVPSLGPSAVPSMIGRSTRGAEAKQPAPPNRQASAVQIPALSYAAPAPAAPQAAMPSSLREGSGAQEQDGLIDRARLFMQSIAEASLWNRHAGAAQDPSGSLTTPRPVTQPSQLSPREPMDSGAVPSKMSPAPQRTPLRSISAVPRNVPVAPDKNDHWHHKSFSSATNTNSGTATPVNGALNIAMCSTSSLSAPGASPKMARLGGCSPSSSTTHLGSMTQSVPSVYMAGLGNVSAQKRYAYTGGSLLAR